MTSPGWLSGGNSREEAGLPGGPSAVITKQGLFRFEEDTKELYLDAIYPETTLEDVKKQVPWELKTAEDLGKEIQHIEHPKKKDIEFIRDFEPFFGMSGHFGRLFQAQVLPVHYERGEEINIT